jgi:hypothetical protein
MSMGWVAAAVAVVGAAVSYENGKKQEASSKRALEQSKNAAKQQALLAEQDMNAANKKRASTTGLLSAAQQAGKAGISGTMLTGAGGVDSSKLSLGKSTLLGG